MGDLRMRIDELSLLLEEFQLEEATLEGDDWSVSFRRTPAPVAGAAAAPLQSAGQAPASTPAAPVAPAGTPVSSPMNGIFYASPSPNAPPFVKEGQTVTAGDVVGLIEAMKVFNEITAPVTGTVLKVAAESGQVVQPGEPLLYIG